MSEVMVTRVHITSQLPLAPHEVDARYSHRVKNVHNEIDQSTFAARLIYAMSTRGIKAPTLASKIDVTRQAIYKWRKGKAEDLDAKSLLTMCRYLGIRPEWLMEGEQPMFQIPILRPEEKDLVLLYRDLSPDNKATLSKIAATLSSDSDGPPSTSRPYRNS